MNQPTLPTEIETQLVAAVRREKRGWLKGAIGMAVFGALFSPAVYFTATPPPGVSPLMAALGTAAFFVLIGALMLLPALGDPRKTKGVALLRTRPSTSIVWLFVQYPPRGRAAAHVSFGFDDGTMGSVRVPYLEAERVFDWLCAYAPNAVDGFTDERLQRFHQEPHSLSRAAA